MDEDAERDTGAAVDGRAGNDMREQRGWDDFGDDGAGTLPDFIQLPLRLHLCSSTFNQNRNLKFHTVLHSNCGFIGQTHKWSGGVSG